MLFIGEAEVYDASILNGFVHNSLLHHSLRQGVALFDKVYELILWIKAAVTCQIANVN